MTAAERAAASEAICHAGNALLETQFSAGQVVTLYAAKGSEVDTAQIDEFARARGLVVVYPRVNWQSRLLTFHAVTPEELVPTRVGLREPRVDSPAVPLGEIAAFVVPGLAFDRVGWRIGWGRGHYDATFAAAAPQALRIGLAFECQLVDAVAHEPHDVALNIIITEVTTHMVV